MNSVQSTALKQRVIEHFDEAARSYGQAYSDSSPVANFFNRRKEIVLAMLGRQLADGRVLDVGCGPGMMVEACLEKGFSYTGVDISPGMIAECQHRYDNCQDASFSVANIQSLPFSDTGFEVVLCMGVLEYLPAGTESQAIAEMARVLRHDGLLIVSYLNAVSFYWIFDRWYGLFRNALAEPWRWLGSKEWSRYPSVEARKRKVPVRKFRKHACSQSLARSGLSVFETVFFDMGLLPSPLDRRLPRLACWVSRWLESFATGLLRHQAKGFILAARKQTTS